LSVAPLPHFRTLYLHPDACRVKLTTETPSIGEFGRLHFTTQELKALERKGKTKMAFELIDASTLPVSTRGRASTEPKVSVTEGGRFMFNKLIHDKWEAGKVSKLLIFADKATSQMAFKGFDEAGTGAPKGTKPEAFHKLAVGKANDDYSAGGSGLLKQLGYKFEEWGNQSYEAKWSEKNGMYVITLFTGTPVKRPVTPRKPKEAKPATTAPSPATVAAIAPAEDELMDLN
jgi:hypothetical protein